jgi:hypothetical protein
MWNLTRNTCQSISILGNVADQSYVLFMNTTAVEERLTSIKQKFNELKNVLASSDRYHRRILKSANL